MSQLTDYLYQIAAHAKAEGREDVCKWIMSHMAKEERAARPKRKRKYHVGNRLTGQVIGGRQGEVWIPPALLKQAEEDGDGGD